MQPEYLTPEGYKKLQEELDFLRTAKRQEVAIRLKEAVGDGDLLENAEYEAAKNEQSFVEGRIQDLEIKLSNARIIKGNGGNDVVQVGSYVTIIEEGYGKTKYYIVGAVESSPREGRISNESPLGKALLKKKVGDVVKIDAPDGWYEVKVIKVE